MFLLQAFQFVVESVARFFILLMLLRFLMQVVRIPFQQPIGQFVTKMTSWLVLKLRKALPYWRGYDIASLSGGFLIGLVLHIVLYTTMPTATSIGDPAVWIALLLYGLLELIRLTVYCLIGAVVIQAVLSWTNPFHPMAGLMRKLTDPLLRPIQRILPPIANIDLSPLILLLLLQVLLIAPVRWMDERLDILLRFGA